MLLQELRDLLAPLAFLCILATIFLGPIGLAGLVLFLVDKYNKIDMGKHRNLIIKISIGAMLLTVLLIVCSIVLFLLSIILPVL